LIATPFGENGKGGIDRMMDVVRHYFRDRPEAGFELRFVTTRGPRSLLFAPIYFGGALLSLIALRLTGKVDLVHINVVQRGSAVRKLMLARLTRALGAKYIFHLHGSEFRQYWESRSPSVSRKLTDAFNRAACTLVLGRVWAEFVKGRAPESRIVVLPNATVSPAKGRDHLGGEGPVHILFLGRVGQRKGVPDLIEALARIAPEAGWRATIAGDGDVAGAQVRIAAAGLADRVELTGWVGPDGVNRLLSAADVLVLPSHDENLPLSVIEGMAYGLAVVATPVGAVCDIIRQDETGLLTPPGDPARLAENLRRLVADAALRAKLGANARALHASRLNVESYMAALKNIWLEAASS
jgi:glycosyltransferase involved in cell wall biosynthesis